MMRILGGASVAALVAATPAVGATLLDDFNTAQATISTDMSSPVSSEVASASAALGARDLTLSSSPTGPGNTATVTGGILDLSFSGSTTGSLLVGYDGIGIPGPGVSPVDLTVGGQDTFGLFFDFIQGNLDITITVESAGQSGSIFTNQSFFGDDDIDVELSFNSIDNPSVDFSAVSSVFIEIDALSAAADVNLDFFDVRDREPNENPPGVIPIPAPIALLLTGIAGIAYVGRRKAS